SVAVLEALARALRLDDAERRHQLTLADHTPSGPDPIIEYAPDALVRLIESMAPAPAYVLGPWFDFLAWNRPQSLLYPMIDHLPEGELNLLWVIFAEPSARTLIAEWDDQARRLLAEFRAATAPIRDAEPVVDLVKRLHDASPEFAAWWSEQDVAGFRTRLRRYHHPNAGELVFEYQQLTPIEWPGLRVACQLPVPGDDSAQRLAAWRNIA
ncbi:MAG: XRE family transcriptional regulator, partial [Ilumatobacteraceae bacterium]